jgi:DNA-binding IclR family transcriptional regulator
MQNNDNVATVDWAQLVRAEYLEVPGLELTREQAQRLWGLDRAVCDELLAALVESRFLRRTRDNRYLLAGDAV